MTTTTQFPLNAIPGGDLLLAWADELKTACAAKNDREWRDVSRAAILVIDDDSRVKGIAQLIAEHAGLTFLSVEAEDVPDLAPYAAFRKQAPALIYLEPGEWMSAPDDDADAETKDKRIALHKRLLKWIDDFNPETPVVLLTANTELGDMCGRIDRPGYFDRYFVVPPLSFTQRGSEFIEAIGQAVCAPSLIDNPEKLGKLLAGSYQHAKRREMAALWLRRTHRREQRLIEFIDLMHLSTHGFGEEPRQSEDNERVRRQTAIHEAGHALIAVLDSVGADVPEYCSIVPGADFKGVVATSVDYYQSTDVQTTFRDFRHNVRVSLAGRAGEELGFGPEEVSTGASADLESAWAISFHAFARWGFAPDMSTPEAAASNLAVVVNKPTDSESEYVEALIREFITREYLVVRDLLAQHRPVLDALTERLMWDPIVDQDELRALCQEHGIASK